MSQSKILVWAIDPSDSDKIREIRLKELLTTLKDSMDVKIQPVNVVSSSFLITGEYFEPINLDDLNKNILQSCEEYLATHFANIELEVPHIIENHYSSSGIEASLFCDYLDEVTPDFVLASTHGRSGWARTFLGSFVESVLLKTTAPTFVLGPECKKITKMKSALMPIQLGESNQNFVESFLDDHRLSFVEKLVLFHKISVVDIEQVAWAPSLYGLTEYSSEDLINKAEVTVENYFKALLAHPLSEKRLEYSISKKLNPVAEVIIKKSEDYDITIMKSDCGAFEANILGSITREVVRNSSCPVIVYPVNFRR